MTPLVERAWFALSLALGKLLRAARYSETGVVRQGDQVVVRKRRIAFAPLLVRMGDVLMRMLATGVRVLSQREWHERERTLYERVHGGRIAVDTDGTLLLPFLAGDTLAALLEDHALPQGERARAAGLAAAALAELHRLGFTHGDAMAENVMVDGASGVARWFDFETMHDARRADVWCRADDVRALLATCLLRTEPPHLREVLALVLDAYADESIVPLVARSFGSASRRALPFHLGQAPLSYRTFREIGRLLREREQHAKGTVSS